MSLLKKHLLIHSSSNFDMKQLGLFLSFITLVKYGETFRLNVIHVNDIHAHFEEVSGNLGRCHHEKDEECFGGAARLLTKVQQLRNNSGNVKTLFLNAGDYYQGTIWYTILKYEPIVALANLLNYTAFAIGNHDFDDGIDGLLPFLQGANFPILAANLDVSNLPRLQGLIKPSITLTDESSGTKIGIVGYITPRTANISVHGESLIIKDEILAVNEECQRLEKQGVKILIALGHSGYYFDKILAREVPLVDLVIGGHSHSFLYTGENPPDHPEGDYPTYVKQSSGKVVPVVQAGSYSKYVGFMELEFDSNGDLLKPVEKYGVKFAKPLLLDASIDASQTMLDAMKPFQEKLIGYRKPIGNASVDLTRKAGEECNLGDVVTDAFRSSPWSDIDISFINPGGLRSIISQGEITLEDAYAVLPFNNSLHKVELFGKDIKEILSSKLRQSGKSILQVSGAKLHYRKLYDSSQWILESVQVPCENEGWCEILDEKLYKVALTSYLAHGYDGWSFPRHIKFHEVGNQSVDSLRFYLQKHSPITQRVEGRITISYDLQPKDTINTFFIIFCINLIMVLTFLAALKFCCRSKHQNETLEVPYQSFY